MNGLEAIKERILADARESAEAVRNRAEQQLAKITAEGEAGSARIISDAREKAAKYSQAAHMRARSMAALEKRRALLQARRDLVDQVIEKAVTKICELPDERKVEFYVNLLKSVDDGRSDGEVKFAAGEEKLADAVLADFSGRLQRSAESGNFGGGVILRRGRIEENMSLEMIVRNNRSELVRIAARWLFPASPANGEMAK